MNKPPPPGNTIIDNYLVCTRDLGNATRLVTEVAPYNFMFPPYRLQIIVTLQRLPDENLGSAVAHDRTRTPRTITAAHVNAILATVGIVPCPRCSTPAFNPETVETDRGGLCEPCYLDDIETKVPTHADAESQERVVLALAALLDDALQEPDR